MPNTIIVHSIGSHPVDFGRSPDLVSHRFHHLEDMGVCGQEITMRDVFVSRSKKRMADTYLVHVIRHINQVPATIEVLNSLNRLGFKSLGALIYDKSELWVGGEVISIACLGSVFVVDGKNMGVVFHIGPTRTDVEYFPARNKENYLPVSWIYPSIVRVA